MENLIVINGVTYINSRQIEQRWNLCKSKQWKEMQTSGIKPVQLASMFFYPLDEVEQYMDQHLTKRTYTRKT